MRGTGTFDPEALSRSLKALAEADSGAGTLPRSAPLAAYCQFYQLDFSAVHPDLRHSVGWLPSGAQQIAVQQFSHPTPRGTAVVCHGYYDHVGLYGHLIEFLLSQGLSVVTFDQPGHGLSTGPRASIGSFDEYVQVLADVLDHYGITGRQSDPQQAGHDGPTAPFYLVGQSMGGAIAMEYLAAREEALLTEALLTEALLTERVERPLFEQVVLLAPLIRPARWAVSWLAYQLARRTITERPRVITDNAENPEFMALMRSDPLAPMVLPVQWVTAMIQWMKRFESRRTLPFEPLVVQGQADQTVDWRHTLKVLKAKTRPTLLEIPDARHHLVNESEVIRRQIFDWLAPHLNPDH